MPLRNKKSQVAKRKNRFEGVFANQNGDIKTLTHKPKIDIFYTKLQRDVKFQKKKKIT